VQDQPTTVRYGCRKCKAEVQWTDRVCPQCGSDFEAEGYTELVSGPTGVAWRRTRPGNTSRKWGAELGEGEEALYEWEVAFPDEWALLNASEERLRTVAQSDPWGGPQGWPELQIRQLAWALYAIRELYKLASVRPIDRNAWSVHRSSAVTILRKWFPTFYIEPLIGDDGEPCMRYVAQDDLKPNLFRRVHRWLGPLWSGLAEANPSTVYVCEGCGIVGSGRYKNRRFCSDACRKRASRGRGIQVNAKVELVGADGSREVFNDETGQWEHTG